MGTSTRSSFIICLIPSLTLAWPNGAPSTTCNSLQPSHGSRLPQRTPFPYTITVDKLLLENQLTPVRITVSPSRIPSRPGGPRPPPPPPKFKGFLIIAQRLNESSEIGDIRAGRPTLRQPGSEWPESAIEKSVGRFQVPDGEVVEAQNLPCGDDPESGLTHTDNGLKSQLVVEWVPSGVKNGEYVFLVTIVQDFNTFWIREQSPSIEVRREGPSGPDPDDDDAHVASAQAIYNGCGKTKGCFGLPSGCVTSADCQMVVTWFQNTKNLGNLRFGVGGLLPKAGSNTGHVSVGFSSDDKMGSDSVAGCVLQNGKVHAKAYYNLPGTKNNAILKEELQDLVEEGQYGNYQDGFIFCEFDRPMVQAAKDPIGQDFDMTKVPYYLLLARSLTVKEEKLGYHVDSVADKGVSKSAVVLAQFKGILDGFGGVVKPTTTTATTTSRPSGAAGGTGSKSTSSGVSALPSILFSTILIYALINFY